MQALLPVCGRFSFWECAVQSFRNARRSIAVGTGNPREKGRDSPLNRKRLGRNELARETHFRKAGPTEKTGHERTKERRQQDRLEERDARQQPDEAERTEE